MLYVAGMQYIEKPRNDQCTQSKCHTGVTTTYDISNMVTAIVQEAAHATQ